MAQKKKAQTQGQVTAGQTSSEASDADERDFVLVQTTNGRARRRGGLSFGPEPTKLYPEDHENDVLRAIETDPVLKISVG